MRGLFVRAQLRLRSWLEPRLRIGIKGRNESIFVRCVSYVEYYRFKSLYEKEPGTVEWLHSTFGEESVLLDIGANVGLYSILAARLGGENSRVYSVEPNAFNFVRLLENMSRNAVIERVIPLNIALSSEHSVKSFYYNSSVEGASGSQIGRPVTEYGIEFDAVQVEKKICSTVDKLCEYGVIEHRVTHVKIDVDGHEYQILMGMKDLLSGDEAPDFIQIEINPGLSDDIDRFVESYGYKLAKRTHTLTSRQSSRAIEEVAHNALFARSNG